MHVVYFRWHGGKFKGCLHGWYFWYMIRNLEQTFQRCVETNLVLIWDKCNILVGGGIVLGQKEILTGIGSWEFKVWGNLEATTTNFGKRYSFFGAFRVLLEIHQRLLKNCTPIGKLLEKEAKFVFEDTCMETFKCLKLKLISTLVFISPDWCKTFKVTCDASGASLDDILG